MKSSSPSPEIVILEELLASEPDYEPALAALKAAAGV